ncbi:MAG: hypothetical protein IJX30_09425 [Clostridia bacterium]|nr:hypothetical protein [Clostridia bacterium]MBQ8430286.1 hypothetical protein [Clostridia bacterium]
MVYEIAGLRVRIENKYEYTDAFCKEYLAKEQNLPVDIIAKVTDSEMEAEKQASPNFSDGYIENICLYRSLCLQIPAFKRMLMHCAVLEYEGKGYAFLGKSGTGKSTHTKLWKRYLKTPTMINGDKPILEETENGFIAYGTPWRGKEGWGTNASAPLCGLCFLEQAKENSIRKLTPSEVSGRLFQQILMPNEESAAIATLELTDKLIMQTPAYLLRCDISEEAVKLSFEALTGLKYHY